MVGIIQEGGNVQGAIVLCSNYLRAIVQGGIVPFKKFSAQPNLNEYAEFNGDFQPKIIFMSKFGPKTKNCQFKLQFGT